MFQDDPSAHKPCTKIIVGLIEPPTQTLVELLGSVDVGHGDDVDLELHVDLLLFQFTLQ